MKSLLILCICSIIGCKEPTVISQQSDPISKINSKEIPIPTNNKGNTIHTRIIPPKGYLRTKVKAASFANYLRNLKLKPSSSQVKYFDGSIKPHTGVYTEVIDLPIGNKDLHQCADAVMRLKGEYLWNTGQFDKIQFNFTNGHRVAYSEWMKGNRISIKDNKTWWQLEQSPSNTYEDFWNYMELIFTYAGTASLEKELIASDWKNAEVGDVLIQGGYPGHAVIIVDKAVHEKTGDQLYLLAQSYMPAQEIQILINPLDSELSPWYKFEEGIIKTPEWVFNNTNIKRFAN